MQPVGRENYCQCLFYASGALSRVLNRMAEEAFGPTGLAPSQAFALMTVCRKPGIQPGELSSVLMLAPSTLTRLVEKLETKKLVERRGEAKATFVHPTEKGKRMEPQLRLCWEELLRRYVEVLGEKAARELTTATYEAAIKLE